MDPVSVAGGGGERLLDRYPRARRREALHRQQMLRVRGRSVAWVPPLLLLIGIALVDVYAEFRIVSWSVLVPGIAAAICGVWGTAMYGALALVTYLVLDSAWPHEFRAGLPDFVLVAIGGVLALLACAVRVRGEAHMVRMRDIAETTRRTVLRPLPVPWGGLDHAAVYLAADVDARVGGDFYDIQPGLHGTRVLVGDVQGKGLGAVETAAALLGTFREAGYHERELRTVAERLEVRMRRHRELISALGRTDGDRFATAVLLGFPADAGDAVDVMNFGHEPPLVAGPGGVRVLPVGDGLPLGLGELVSTGASGASGGSEASGASGGESLPSVRRFPLADGETLLVTTDGVTEARNAGGEFYPLAEEVTRMLAADARGVRPRRLVVFVRDGVLRHSGGHLADDTTVFAVRRL
ncbi:PP2C family protein-serine/threonine phosphatase [Streptomyces sp. HC307]|uniref:PP2C family protein-serine/threonine phosphatase n=1 Tax=Streptomyces flavusporus TaxID=3385496 RepID=UPI00391712BE